MNTTMRVLLGLCVPSLAFAVPMQLTNTGRLVDTAGVGLSGPNDLTFTLYTDAGGVNALWSETISADFSDGFYSVVLGDVQPIDEVVLDQYPLYLGLSVNGAAEMLPRYEVVSVPYAVMAETAANVVGGTVDAAEIRVNGSPVVDADGNWAGEPPVEEDPIFSSSVAATIGAGHVADWSAACSWGDHSTFSYLTTEVDPAFTASAAAAITASHVAEWTEALRLG